MITNTLFEQEKRRKYAWKKPGNTIPDDSDRLYSSQTMFWKQHKKFIELFS